MRRTLLLAALACSACATLKPQVSFQSMGVIDPDRDLQVTTSMRKAAQEHQPPPHEVAVLLNALPEGLSFNNGEIKVESGYQHQLLGSFSLMPQTGLFYLT